MVELDVDNGGANGGGGGPIACTYARLSTEEVPLWRDLRDFWEEPGSYFILPGMLLREATEDLEWTGGEVTLQMRRDPPRLRFLSEKQGSSLQVGGRAGGRLPGREPRARLGPGLRCVGSLESLP